jgi:hypothetical protein
MFTGTEDAYDYVVVEVANPAETINEIERALNSAKEVENVAIAAVISSRTRFGV